MRILLFGASGGIGHHVRRLTLVAGHELVLFARDPAALAPLTERETALEGDIADSGRVAAAVAGVDAVISVLGPTSNSSDQVRLFEEFARTLVAAMRANGVKRLVTISGGAVTLPAERKSFRARIASALVRRVVPHVVEAKQRELDVVVASDLDWIAPRPPRVVDGPATGRYTVGERATGLRVTQGDLAHFMVAALTDDSFIRQAPLISS